jgi:hypothetical protein
MENDDLLKHIFKLVNEKESDVKPKKEKKKRVYTDEAKVALVERLKRGREVSLARRQEKKKIKEESEKLDIIAKPKEVIEKSKEAPEKPKEVVESSIKLDIKKIIPKVDGTRNEIERLRKQVEELKRYKPLKSIVKPFKQEQTKPPLSVIIKPRLVRVKDMKVERNY